MYAILAILLALKTFANDKSETHIRIMTDNSTAASVINNIWALGILILVITWQRKFGNGLLRDTSE